jgi:hypothetical protein
LALHLRDTQARQQRETCQRQPVLAGCRNASKAVLPQPSVNVPNLFIRMVSVGPPKMQLMIREFR